MMVTKKELFEYIEFLKAIENIESTPEYQSKINLDAILDSDEAPITYERKEKHAHRYNSRIRNKEYKEKTIKRFLSLNPAMDYSKLSGLRCETKLWACAPFDKNGHDLYSNQYYFINSANKLYVSRRGDIRQYTGGMDICSAAKGHFWLYCKNNDKHATNKRIRADKSLYSMLKLSYIKKKYATPTYVDTLNKDGGFFKAIVGGEEDREVGYYLAL